MLVKIITENSTYVAKGSTSRTRKACIVRDKRAAGLCSWPKGVIGMHPCVSQTSQTPHPSPTQPLSALKGRERFQMHAELREGRAHPQFTLGEWPKPLHQLSK